MKIATFIFSMVTLFVRLAVACEALAPTKPVKVVAVCGYVQSPTGERLSEFPLRLVRKDQTLVSEVKTDSAGNFQFGPTDKGDYYLTATNGWCLGWPVEVTGSKSLSACPSLLIVQPSLLCGGSVSKKGYHPKFSTRPTKWSQ